MKTNLSASFLVLLSVARAHAAEIPPIVRLVRAIAPPEHRADIATCITVVKDGAVIAGYTTKDDGDEDGLIMRVNDAGETVWRREIGGPKGDDLWGIQPDNAGGFVCAGYTSSSGAGVSDGWIVRVDDNGEVTWQKTFGQAGADKFWSIARDGDNWIAVGETEGRGAGGLDSLIVRIDKTGNEIASFTNGGAQLDRAFSIVPTSDGGCAIGGMTGKDRDHSFAYIARIAKDGTEIWRRVIEDAGIGVVHDLHAGKDDELIGVGYAQAKDRSDPDGLVVRLNAKGEIMSQKTFGSPTADRALHARVFDDRSSVIVGYTQRAGHGNPDALWDLCAWRLDRDDNLVSTQRFGGTKVEFGRAIAGDRSNLWIAGHTESFGGRSSVYLVRLSAMS